MNFRSKVLSAALSSVLCLAAFASCEGVVIEDVPPAAFNGNQASQVNTPAADTVQQDQQTAAPTEQTNVSSESAAPASTPAEKPKAKNISLSFYETSIKVGQTVMPIVNDEIDEVWTSSDENIATVDSIGNITAKNTGSCTITVASARDKSCKADVKVTVQAQPDLTYIDGILIANKTYSLPSDYNPGGLTPETSAAFEELVEGAKKDGIDIYLSSGFRSYEYQDEIYNNYCSVYGQAEADTFSARPGHSEHQTGMAIDVNIIDDSFAGTPEAIWIENHCFEYGFILRYPQGKEGITGYKYEPWHIRYIGDKAKPVHDSGLTLEEYLGITSKYSN